MSNSFVTVPRLLFLAFGTLTSYHLHCLGSLAGVIFVFGETLDGEVYRTESFATLKPIRVLI